METMGRRIADTVRDTVVISVEQAGMAWRELPGPVQWFCREWWWIVPAWAIMWLIG